MNVTKPLKASWLCPDPGEHEVGTSSVMVVPAAKRTPLT